MARKSKKQSYNARSKYAKIPIKTKVKFLRKVVMEGMSIRDSATIHNINYSTAKTLIRQYKTNSFDFDLELPTQELTVPPLDQKNSNRCGYKDIGDYRECKFQTIPMVYPSFYLKGEDDLKGDTQENASADRRPAKMGVEALYSKFEIISSISYY